VEKHRANLMRKLHLRNVTELVLMAVDMGLVERPDINRMRNGLVEESDARSAGLEPSGREPATPLGALDQAFG
jgi:hypothetical protein